MTEMILKTERLVQVDNLAEKAKRPLDKVLEKSSLLWMADLRASIDAYLARFVLRS